MKSIIFVTTLSVMLAACSGGGGGSGGGSDTGSSNTPAPQPVAAQQLSSTIGTWAADCSEHELEYATITRASDDTVKIASKIDYYSGANCTGTIVGTQTDTGDVSVTYAGTADASVTLAPGTSGSASAVKVDRFAATVPAYSVTVAGSGVTRATKDGMPQWCMRFGDEGELCIHDDGTRQASTSSGALYVQGNQIYMLSADGAGYKVDQRMTRK
jgi:hypothetical protein